jgi:hypothetical protein
VVRHTPFVLHCADPYCDGADRAARPLARRGRTARRMIVGATGCLDEGVDLVGRA